MTLVKNVKLLDQVDATLVLTKADAPRRRTFKSDKRKNYVSQTVLYYFVLHCLAMILAACGTPAPASKAPIVTEAVSTVTKIAPTNTLEPTATQVVLDVVTGHIVFQSNRDGDKEIYVMNGDGSGLTNLTDNLADDVSPDWSP